MGRTLCLVTLVLAVVAVVILSNAEQSEATPRFFSFGLGRGHGGGGRRGGGVGRNRVVPRRIWRPFRYFRRNRKPKYYRPMKPITQPPMVTPPITQPTQPMTMAPTTTPGPTQPPTRCAPIQSCNITNHLDPLTNALYSNLISEAEGAARANAMEVLAEFQANREGGDCASITATGNRIVAMFSPGATNNNAQYMMELRLNEGNTRVLQVNYSTPAYPNVGRVKLCLDFAGGVDLENDAANLVAIRRYFTPPGEEDFFPLPLQSLTCSITLDCGVDVVPPSVLPTEPNNPTLPQNIPMLQITDGIGPVIEVTSTRCSPNTGR